MPQNLTNEQSTRVRVIGARRLQAITLANIDPDLWSLITRPQGVNTLMGEQNGSQ